MSKDIEFALNRTGFKEVKKAKAKKIDMAKKMGLKHKVVKDRDNGHMTMLSGK